MLSTITLQLRLLRVWLVARHLLRQLERLSKCFALKIWQCKGLSSLAGSSYHPTQATQGSVLRSPVLQQNLAYPKQLRTLQPSGGLRTPPCMSLAARGRDLSRAP